MGHNPVARHDDDSIANEVILVIYIGRLPGRGDNHVITNARVAVDDGILDSSIPSDTDARNGAALGGCDGFRTLVIISPEQDYPV